jgi:hypothetical protein
MQAQSEKIFSSSFNHPLTMPKKRKNRLDSSGFFMALCRTLPGWLSIEIKKSFRERALQRISKFDIKLFRECVIVNKEKGRVA